ncbi:MAG: hypothetical protein ACAH83_14125 [Alphaproteobacteria bacterium]
MHASTHLTATHTGRPALHSAAHLTAAALLALLRIAILSAASHTRRAALHSATHLSAAHTGRATLHPSTHLHLSAARLRVRKRRRGKNQRDGRHECKSVHDISPKKIQALQVTPFCEPILIIPEPY